MTLTTDQLVDAFMKSGQQVFHLMGGAPALRLEHWPELIRGLQVRCPDAVFHSDLLCTEKDYEGLLQGIQSPMALYAVNVKGVDEQEYLANTRRPFPREQFWHNLGLLVRNDVRFYITFTSVSDANHDLFWEEFVRRFSAEVAVKFKRDAFCIDLIQYEATAHADDVPWGAVR
jgi:pyruvate-formate lyase-activating enzyme